MGPLDGRDLQQSVVQEVFPRMGFYSKPNHGMAMETCASKMKQKSNVSLFIR